MVTRLIQNRNQKTQVNADADDLSMKNASDWAIGPQNFVVVARNLGRWAQAI